MDNSEVSPESFPQRLKDRRLALGLSQKKLADYTDISLKTIQKYEYGDIPRGRNLIRLASALNCSTDWLLLGSGYESKGAVHSGTHHPKERIDLTYVPQVLPRLKNQSNAFEESPEKNKYAFRRDWLEQKGDPSQMVLMEVPGDSMSPEIKDGDTVLLDQRQRELFIGKIYAVRIDQEVMVRYLDRAPGKIILHGSNQWHDIEIGTHEDTSEMVNVLGRVVWWCRDTE
jgi:phage repressor protein C with HTH and peptisase S24 domain